MRWKTIATVGVLAVGAGATTYALRSRDTAPTANGSHINPRLDSRSRQDDGLNK